MQVDCVINPIIYCLWVVDFDDFETKISIIGKQTLVNIQ